MWYQARFFHYSSAILIVLWILFFLYQLYPLLIPIENFFLTIFTPVLAAGILYYLLRPLVRKLEVWKIPRFFGILIIYAGVAVVATLVLVKIYPTLSSQISEVLFDPSKKLEIVKERTVSIISVFNFDVYTPVELQNLVSDWLQAIYNTIKKNLLDILGKTTHVAAIVAFIPFILFYLLKDDRIFYSYFIGLVPLRYKGECEKLFSDLDFTLTTFINGQLLIAFLVGLLLFCGFVVIGLNYALVLAFFGMVVNTIPFIGPFIAVVPALLVGWAISPFMGIKVIVVMIIIHLFEANLLSPQVIGQRLNIHPLTIVLLLLACGSLYGILGMLLATPAYALLRVLAYHAYGFYVEGIRVDSNYANK